MSWTEYKTDGSKKSPKALVAVVLVAVLLAGIVGFSVFGGNSQTAAQQRAAQGGLTANGSLNEAISGLDATTTTMPDVLVNEEAQPEAGVLDASQLAAQYPQSASGLTVAEFERAVSVAKAFNLADATGQGADAFPTYYDDYWVNTPWVVPSTYKVLYTYAQSVNGLVVKTTQWFTGTTSLRNRSIDQATSVVYLQVNSDGSYSPINPDAVVAAGYEDQGFESEIVYND